MNTLMLIPLLPLLLSITLASLVYEISAALRATNTKPLKPMFAMTKSTLGITMVFRSPIKRHWLFNVSIGNPLIDLATGFKPAVRIAMLAIIALVYIACQGPTEARNNQVTVNHPTACIELPIVTTSDTLIKHIETYTLKPSDSKRARCHSDGDDLVYTCKGKNPDTLYNVSDLCPASAKMLQSLGGN